MSREPDGLRELRQMLAPGPEAPASAAMVAEIVGRIDRLERALDLLIDQMKQGAHPAFIAERLRDLFTREGR